MTSPSSTRAGSTRRDRQLRFDPQTSGGLLVAVPPAATDELIADLARSEHRAALIGEVLEGPARLEIT